MKNIGVFCSDNNIFCVERIGNKPGKMFFVEGPDDGSRRHGPAAISVTPEILAQFAQEFEKQNFKTNQINLALPSRDIIFRSFIIPWMPAHEIKNVVDYEIDKYLPFEKSELRYSFHDIKFVQDTVRKIRIVFIGIKKISLSQYVERFKQIGLEVNLVEPADISLLQTLSTFNEISANETITLVKKYKDCGKLMIVDQGIPLFVREFSFAAPDADQEMMTTRLVNEVIISLDYFTRQDQQFICKKILFLSSVADPALVFALQDNVGMTVKSVEANRLFPGQMMDNIKYINAFGVGLKGTFGISIDFNSIPDEVDTGEKAATKNEKQWETVSTFIVIAVCALMIVIGFLLPSFMTQKYNQQLKDIQSQMPGVEVKTTDDLKFELGLIQERMDKLTGTRLNSEAAYFLQSISELLPDGVWLRDFNFNYKEDAGDKAKLELFLYGYSYAADQSAEFKQINVFLNKLRADKKFAGYFSAIDVNSMSLEDVRSYQVTNFKITCR